MTNAETKAHLLRWVAIPHSHWAWPTDACGYDQHIKFVEHRNELWHGGTLEEFKQFVVEYANSLGER
jgi:hypothetical protein